MTSGHDLRPSCLTFSTYAGDALKGRTPRPLRRAPLRMPARSRCHLGRCVRGRTQGHFCPYMGIISDIIPVYGHNQFVGGLWV